VTEASRQRHIARPVEEVWAALGEFGAIARWASDVDHSCLLTHQQTGVGTTRRVQIGRMTLVERVTTWEPDPPSCTLGYDLEGLPRALGDVSTTWSLERVGSGTTATMTTRIDAGPRPPQKLVARIGAVRMGKAAESMLEGLAQYVTRTEATA
jgi:uncharacterized protein YndB with AHSA1/START domain